VGGIRKRNSKKFHLMRLGSVFMLGISFLLVMGCADNPEEPEELDYTATLELSPETVDSYGEIVAVVNLICSSIYSIDQPVAGSTVTFEITQGPASFIDSDGNDIGASTTGSGPTDSGGNAFARIRAGDTADTTNVIVRAVSDTGAVATQSFTIERNLGLIHFYPGPENPYPKSIYTVQYAYTGSLPAEVTYIIPFHLEHTDGNGEPLANEDIVLDTYLPSDSIQSITLGEDTALPATLTTDDDGISDFVLYATVTTDELAADGNIGSLVLTGTSVYDVRGSIAIVFNVPEESADQPLAVYPSIVWLSDGQPVSIAAVGGVPPYTWSVAGGGTLSSTTGASIIYTAPTPMVSSVVTVTDDAGHSDVSLIWAW
jgi:hypothetical protein